MFEEKGPITAVEVLATGIVDLIVSPFIFILRWISKALLLPVDFVTAFFDFSEP